MPGRAHLRKERLMAGSPQTPPRGLEMSTLADSPAGSKEEGCLRWSASAPWLELPLPLANGESLGRGAVSCRPQGDPNT